MVGYQADLGQQYWGCLYDESRRRTILAKPDAKELDKVLKRGIGMTTEFFVKAAEFSCGSTGCKLSTTPKKIRGSRWSEKLLCRFTAGRPAKHGIAIFASSR